MVKVLVVNKNSSGVTMAVKHRSRLLLVPKATNTRVAGRSSGLLPPSSAFPTREKVSDILEEAQNGAHSYGHSR